MNRWLGGATEKTAIVQDMIKNKEVSEREAWKVYSELMNLPFCYGGFISDVQKEMHITLIRGT